VAEAAAERITGRPRPLTTSTSLGVVDVTANACLARATPRGPCLNDSPARRRRSRAHGGLDGVVLADGGSRTPRGLTTDTVTCCSARCTGGGCGRATPQNSAGNQVEPVSGLRWRDSHAANARAACSSDRRALTVDQYRGHPEPLSARVYLVGAHLRSRRARLAIGSTTENCRRKISQNVTGVGYS